MALYDATMKDGTCIFCDIIRKNDPNVILWEDTKHAAFLSIDPNTPGFTLVVPKQHYGSDILGMPDEALRDFIVAAKNVSEVLKNFYESVGRVGLIMEGTGIDHAHIKLIPMHGTEHMKKGEWKQMFSDAEHWFETYEGWLSSAGGPMADRAQLTELTTRIKNSQKTSVGGKFDVHSPHKK